jgi:hypothetical protein
VEVASLIAAIKRRIATDFAADMLTTSVLRNITIVTLDVRVRNLQADKVRVGDVPRPTT